MKKILMISTAAVAISAGVVLAQSPADGVVSQLQQQGYERIEVKMGQTQMKVEAIRGGSKLEVVYDLATGAILKEEVQAVDSGDDTTPGVEISNERDDDFMDDDMDDDDMDDDSDDDDSDDHDDDDNDDDDHDDDHDDDNDDSGNDDDDND